MHETTANKAEKTGLGFKQSQILPQTTEIAESEEDPQQIQEAQNVPKTLEPKKTTPKKF
jgi:hypothetical protein